MKYKKWSLEKLLAERAGIQDELFYRKCPAKNLPWRVEIVDEVIPYVVRKGESFSPRTFGAKYKAAPLCFAISRSRWPHINDDKPFPDSVHAAIQLCYWLSGVDSSELAEARKTTDYSEAFVWHLTHAVEDKYATDDFDIVIGDVRVGCDTINSRLTTNAAEVLEPYFRRGIPPSDAALKLDQVEAMTYRVERGSDYI